MNYVESICYNVTTGKSKTMKDNDWFKAGYVNQIELALCRFPKLALTNEQFLVVLVILYLQKNNEIISIPTITQQTKLSKERVNEILAVLTNKGYLSIKTKKNKVDFDLSGLFQEDNENLLRVDNNLFNLFEQEFGRVLTHREIEMLAFLQSKYPQEQIEDALRKTLNNDVRSINYVAKILSKTEKSSDDE